jgi:hypothetical protein
MLSECRHKSVRLRRFGINAQIGNYSRKQHVLNSGSEGRYAFDADTSPCTTLWHANLLDSAHGGTTGETNVPSGATGGLVGNGFGDITPEVGVTGTPVIDPVTNTIYVVSKSVDGSTKFFQLLHALDLTTGNERSHPEASTLPFRLQEPATDR